MQIRIDPEIEKFIESLEKPAIAKVLRTIDLLEKFGYKLGLPHARQLSKGLSELRIRGQQEIRIFYCFHGQTINLLSGFVKKSRKTPSEELAKARAKLALLT